MPINLLLTGNSLYGISPLFLILEPFIFASKRRYCPLETTDPRNLTGPISLSGERHVNFKLPN